MEQVPALWGLVLAGGQSSRMGTDKAWLVYDEQPQWLRVRQLLEMCCDCVYVSMNPDQQLPEIPNIILDTNRDSGPMAGVVSAMGTNPEVAWLIVAVDMPRITEATLRQLASHRDSSKAATAYIGSDGYPEPLVSIYEPKSFPRLLELFEKKERSLRKFLMDVDVTLLKPAHVLELLSIDSPEAYQTAKGTFPNHR